MSQVRSRLELDLFCICTACGSRSHATEVSIRFPSDRIGSSGIYSTNEQHRGGKSLAACLRRPAPSRRPTLWSPWRRPPPPPPAIISFRLHFAPSPSSSDPRRNKPGLQIKDAFKRITNDEMPPLENSMVEESLPSDIDGISEVLESAIALFLTINSKMQSVLMMGCELPTNKCKEVSVFTCPVQQDRVVVRAFVKASDQEIVDKVRRLPKLEHHQPKYDAKSPECD